MTSYTVRLSLPECEGTNPAEAVESFCAQADQRDLWVYSVTDNATGQTFEVDMAEGGATREVQR